MTTEDHRKIADVLNDIIAKFDYVGDNYDDFIVTRFDELSKKERKAILDAYEEDDADWKDKAGWEWFREIRRKYRHAIRNNRLVNNQELEAYGLSTQALIDSLLYEKEREKAYIEHCKQLRLKLGLLPLKENECVTKRTSLYMKSAYL